MPRLRSVLGWTFMLAGCTKPPATPIPVYPPLPAADAAAPAANDDARRLGGRLFDDFVKELALDFVPDDPNTPAADGKGGPFGNGTLPDAQGKPMLNTGHGYRLRKLLGPDLHGAAGIAGRRVDACGSAREASAEGSGSCVLLPDLLKNTDSHALWVARLTHGEDAIPAYASVLSSTQLAAIVDFLLGVRDGALPHPDALFALDERAPDGSYRLAPGGVAERGHTLFANSCAGCHGADGTRLTLEGEYSLGTFLRTRASEAWLHVLNGVPGTRMKPQLPVSATGAELTQQLRDLFAAGCDRARYPRGQASHADVEGGDGRCGALLK